MRVRVRVPVRAARLWMATTCGTRAATAPQPLRRSSSAAWRSACASTCGYRAPQRQAACRHRCRIPCCTRHSRTRALGAARGPEALAARATTVTTTLTYWVCSPCYGDVVLRKLDVEKPLDCQNAAAGKHCLCLVPETNERTGAKDKKRLRF